MRQGIAEDSKQVVEDLLSAILRAEAVLTPALASATLHDAVDIAELIEQAARALYPLQLKAAGRVEAESPAARGSAAGASATGRSGEDEPVPYRRGCDLLRTRVRISGSEARRRIRAAAQVLPRTSLTGEHLEPLAPVLSSSLEPVMEVDSASPLRKPGADSTLPLRSPGAEAIDVVLTTVATVEQVAGRVQADRAERTLTAFAATFDPDSLRKLGRHLLACVDADGDEPTEQELRTRQGVRVGATWKGLTHLDIWADAVQAEILLTIFDTGSNPRSAPPRTGDPAGGSVGDPKTPEPDRAEPDGTDAAAADGPDPLATDPDATDPDVVELDTAVRACDDRTRAQRMLDALITACQAALRVGGLPAIAGLPPQLLVTVGLADLRGTLARATAAPGTEPPDTEPPDTEPPGPEPPDIGPRGTDPWPPPRAVGRGTAYLPHRGPLDVGHIRRLACDADLIPVVLGGADEILNYGRAHRLVPAALRKALIARDGGCIFPGCTVPATWTEAHHVVPWSEGGPTDAHVLTLLCSFHHHGVHSGRWKVVPTRPGDLPDTSGRRRPFRVTPPWAALPELTWNVHPRGA